MAYEKTDKAAQKRSRVLRWGLLGLVLVVVTTMATLHQMIPGADKPIGVDALCPFGGLETLFSLIAGGGYLKNIAASSVVLLVGALILALVFRRSFCGQICPFGALQGFFGAIGGKLFKRRPTLPAGLDKFARFLKYGILVFFAVWTWQAATLVMRPYDPWAAWAHITSADLWTEFAVGVVILAISLIGSIVYERFFCKYLCPMGGLLALFSKVSFLRIKRDADACIDCGKCDKACPVNISISTCDTVTSAECISCNECVNACPAKGALEVKAGKTGGAVKPLAVTGIVVAILAGTIGIATAAGYFNWTMPSLADTIKQSTGSAEVGQGFDTSLIKGYMSMGEIAEASGIPREEFTAMYGVPDAELDKPMKEIKDTYGFSPEDVRAWVDEQLAAR